MEMNKTMLYIYNRHTYKIYGTIHEDLTEEYTLFDVLKDISDDWHIHNGVVKFIDSTGDVFTIHDCAYMYGDEKMKSEDIKSIVESF